MTNEGVSARRLRRPSGQGKGWPGSVSASARRRPAGPGIGPGGGAVLPVRLAQRPEFLAGRERLLGHLDALLAGGPGHAGPRTAVRGNVEHGGSPEARAGLFGRRPSPVTSPLPAIVTPVSVFGSARVVSGQSLAAARDAAEALAILSAQNRIDLLITDYLMPVMTGEELAHRARELRPNLKILVLTGHAHALDPPARTVPSGFGWTRPPTNGRDPSAAHVRAVRNAGVSRSDTRCQPARPMSAIGG